MAYGSKRYSGKKSYGGGRKRNVSKPASGRVKHRVRSIQKSADRISRGRGY